MKIIKKKKRLLKRSSSGHTLCMTCPGACASSGHEDLYR